MIKRIWRWLTGKGDTAAHLSAERKADIRRMVLSRMARGTPMLLATDEDWEYLIRLSLGME